MNIVLEDPTSKELLSYSVSQRANAVVDQFFKNLEVQGEDKPLSLAFEDGHYEFQIRSTFLKDADEKKAMFDELKTKVEQVDSNILVKWSKSNRSVNLNSETGVVLDLTSGPVSSWSTQEERKYRCALLWTQEKRSIGPFVFESHLRTARRDSEHSQSTIDCIQFWCGEIQITLSAYSDSTWLIEIDQALSSDDFVKVIHKPLQAVGWLGGYWPQRGLWFFDTDHSAVEYRRLRSKDWKVSLTPVNTNAYAWYSTMPEIAKLWEKRVKKGRISRATLENVIAHMNLYQDFHRIVYQLMEFNQISQEIRPVVTSAAIETFANLSERLDLIKPSYVDKPSKGVSKTIRMDLLRVLDVNLAKDFPELNGVLKEKIQNLFNVKPSNAVRLLKAIQVSGIVVTNADRKAINSRNDYLHGRYSEWEIGTDMQKSLSDSLRIYDMIGTALLRICGYAGPTVNQVFRLGEPYVQDGDEPYRLPAVEK